MADVEIFHPLLGRTVKVPERTVRIWKRSGWVEASTPLARTATAGRASIAPPSADEPTPTPGATTTPHEED